VTLAIPSDRRRRSPSTERDALAGPRFSPNLATSPATAPPLAWLLTPVLLSPDRSRYTPQAIRATPRGWLSFFCEECLVFDGLVLRWLSGLLIELFTISRWRRVCQYERRCRSANAKR